MQANTTATTSRVKSMEERQSSEEFRAITDWLSSDKFPAEQSDIISKRQDGTGKWFVDSPEFTNFLQGEKQSLFCPGIPGAGKTMIAAIAVDHIWKVFKDNNVGVAFIYNNYNRHKDQTVTKLLAAILKQLVRERPLYGEPVKNLHTEHADRGTDPSLDEICNALNSVLNNYSKTYIILDALDECTDDNGTRSNLISILRNLQIGTNTSLLVTSRFDSGIEQSLQGSPTLKIEANEADVKRYVAGQLHRFPMCVKSAPELQVEIQNGIALAVDGM